MQVARGNTQDNWVFIQLTYDEGARAPRSLTAPAPGDREQRLVGLPCAWLFAKPSRKMSCLSPQSCGVATVVCISQTKRGLCAVTQMDFNSGLWSDRCKSPLSGRGWLGQGTGSPPCVLQGNFQSGRGVLLEPGTQQLSLLSEDPLASH